MKHKKFIIIYENGLRDIGDIEIEKKKFTAIRPLFLKKM